MGVRKELTRRALAVGQKAMERLMADEQRAMKIASAIGRVQQGKKSLEKGQDEVLHALNFATRSDYKAVGKQLAGLKRRLRQLEQHLEGLGSRGA